MAAADYLSASVDTYMLRFPDQPKGSSNATLYPELPKSYMPDNHIRTWRPRGFKIIVRAHANIKKLENRYKEEGKISKGASLEKFVQGFNQRQALFDLVDVGGLKAKRKIRGILP